MKTATALPANSVTVKKLPQAYQLTQAPEHKRPTMRRVLYDKFLLWLQDAKLHRIVKRVQQLAIFIVTVLAFTVPSFLMDIASASVSFHGFAPVKIACVLYVAYNWRFLLRTFRSLRAKLKRGGGNQHTFHGVPVPELCDFLMKHRRFTRDLAIARLALSQGQYHKIKDELRKHSVLIRGDNNAWVLNLITRELLQRQLRENFPAYWRSESQEWQEREGVYTTLMREGCRAEPNTKENWFTTRLLETA